MAKVMNIAQLPDDIRQQVLKFAPTKRRRFMRKVVGPVMQGQIIVRFLRGGFTRAGDWKSMAAGAKKFSDRWSADYNERPSGDIVTPASIRNVDTGSGDSFANSYRVITADADSVTVGPGVTKKQGRAVKIAEREENGGNAITGFTTETIGALDREMQAYLDAVANDREPPYLPKSRIGKRGATASGFGG